MTTLATPGPVEDLLTVLSADFAAACRQFAQARRLQCGKDTPAHRSAVAQAHERVDEVLDMYLEAREDPRLAA